MNRTVGTEALRALTAAALLGLLLAACDNDSSAEVEPRDHRPQPGDSAMVRDGATIDTMDILVLESYPPQFHLVLTGSLPTPCHELRADVSDPDADNVIAVDVYSLADPEVVCIQIVCGSPKPHSGSASILVTT